MFFGRRKDGIHCDVREGGVYLRFIPVNELKRHGFYITLNRIDCSATSWRMIVATQEENYSMISSLLRHGWLDVLSA